MFDIEGKHAVAKVFASNIENEAISQIIGMLNNKITLNTQVRVMPDVHAGKGSTIGTTIKLPEDFKDWKVSPNIVGLDVGCGILMYKISNKDLDLEKLDEIVHENIPSGFSIHEHNQNKEFTNRVVDNLTFDLYPNSVDRIHKSLGTLGGGNHFIEVGIDGNGDYWLSVHSGSRNLGLQVAQYHQGVAENLLKESSVDIPAVIERLKAEGKHKDIENTIKILKGQKLPKTDLDLAYLTGDKLKDYLNDMTLAQSYAVKSRETMLDTIVDKMGLTVTDKFDSIHNFIEHDNYEKGMLRKGATSAKKGERLVIPLNMRDGSLICEGLGNEDWNQSAPHGAGRMMSRSKAKAEINIDEFKEQMSGVYSSTVSESTLDEAPDAYKPEDIIKEDIKDTAIILHQVRPIYNFKG